MIIFINNISIYLINQKLTNTRRSFDLTSVVHYLLVNVGPEKV